MTIFRLPDIMHIACAGPDCYIQDPHTHQYFVEWPDDDDDKEKAAR